MPALADGLGPPGRTAGTSTDGVVTFSRPGRAQTIDPLRVKLRQWPRAIHSSRRAERPMSLSRREVALDVEDVADGGVGREKSLSRSGALDALHLAASYTG